MFSGKACCGNCIYATIKPMYDSSTNKEYNLVSCNNVDMNVEDILPEGDDPLNPHQEGVTENSLCREYIYIL